MPDLFDDLLREIATPIEPETPTEEPKVETPEPEGVEPESVEKEDNEELEQEPTQAKPNPVDQVLNSKKEKVETPEEKSSRAFAEMRAKNAKYEKALHRAAEVSGLSVDQLLEQLDDKAIQQQAKTTNTNPDLIRRLEAVEAERAELQTMKVQNHIERQFGKLSQDFKVTQDELLAFTSELIKEGFNFNDLSVDYVTLYRGRNYESLVEKERQQWIARSEKGQQAGTVMSKNGKSSGKDKPIQTMNDLEDFLSGME